MIAGLRIIETEHATKKAVRVRRYPKRKARSHAHWWRMDKKWRKRYGFKDVPCIYRYGNTLFVHPSLMPKLRASLSEQKQETDHAM